MTRSIDALASGESLSREEAAAVLSEIMPGEASEIQIAAFLIALRTKGETVEELAGLAQTMRAFAARVEVRATICSTPPGPGRPADLQRLDDGGADRRRRRMRRRQARQPLRDRAVGLGGRARGARGAHRSGARGGRGCIEEVGFGFMFAPSHHQATRYVIPVRRELAVRTIFNFLGPLTNPAGATRQLIGVSDPAYLETMAGALALLGTTHALLVSSEDGLDELTISATTQVVEVLGDEVRGYTVTPEELGLERAPAEAVPGGDPAENAETTRRIFAGEPGAARDLAVLNAGAAIYAGGGADTLEDGVRAAEQAIDRGAAAELLERFVARTRELAP